MPALGQDQVKVAVTGVREPVRQRGIDRVLTFAGGNHDA
jgi:hypothetical protein